MFHPALLATACAAALALAPTPAAAGPIYLALGDSSAFGETDRTRNPSDGDRGYVKPFADYLAGRYGVRPVVLNLAMNGETTDSFATGTGRASSDGQFLNSNYAAPYPTQQGMFRARVAAALAAGHTIPVVTVQLGANDLAVVAEAAGFLSLTPEQQVGAVTQALGRAAQNYAGILAEVKATLPGAEVYAIGYHNPYAGAPDHPFAPLAGPAVVGVNQVIAGVAAGYGATYVDFYNPVLGRERELTLIMRDDPLNQVHLNDAGYAVVAAELLRTADAPEPGTLALAGIGLAGMAGYRRRGRAALAA